MKYKYMYMLCVLYLKFSRDSSTTPSKYALSDTELTKLKEKAKELSRVREKMRALQDEVSNHMSHFSIQSSMVGII